MIRGRVERSPRESILIAAEASRRVKPHRTALVWFRRDLRLADNPALNYAIDQADRVLPVFIHAPAEEGSWRPGAASDWWLHHSLVALAGDLRDRGARLVVQRGPTLQFLLSLIERTGATLVTWNRLYEPAVLARDTSVAEALDSKGISVERRNAALLFEPWTLRNAQQKCYRVFTPFWRAAERELDSIPAPARPPKQIATLKRAPRSLPVEELDLLPRRRWDSGLAAMWKPGEKGAQRQLRRFGKQAHYDTQRDRPDVVGTSRLSPHLHFGEIGPRQVLASVRLGPAGGAAAPSVASYIRELGWREFAHHLLFHFPDSATISMDRRFENLRWSRSRTLLLAWQRGTTGYPIVDAGMRELWHTGWMHNRVRMIVASLLTKNMRIHWRAGARWFWDTLVDADLANNTLGWQWTAGSGADAAPYYRIFNPVLQAEKFDPDRAYIRRWLPELRKLPDRWIHQPWAAPAEVLSQAGVELGVIYPRPAVELQASRDAALAAYVRIRNR